MKNATRICSFFLGLASACPSAHDLIGIWESSLADGTDAAYTADFSEQRSVLAAPGRIDGGVAFWMPCAWNHPGPDAEPARAPAANFGYHNSIPIAPNNSGFACAQPAGATPLYRFARAAVPADRIYTASLAEARSLAAQGYAFERTEGFVFRSPVAGSVPLYRLSACQPGRTPCAGGHRYTISADTRNTLMAHGYAYEGLAGHVFDGYNNATVEARFTGTLNGVAVDATRATRVAIANVAAPSGTLAVKGQGRHTGFGYLASNATARPARARKQRISFQLDTGTLFDAGSNLDHIPVMLYAHAQMAADGEGALPYDGIGIFFSTPNWAGGFCPSAHALTSGGQIFVEEMGDGKKVDCRANLRESDGVAPLLPNRRYDVSLTVDDGAMLSLDVKDHVSQRALPLATANALPHVYANDYACPLVHSPGALTIDKLHCNNPFAQDRFPNFRTGYALWPIFAATPPVAGKGAGRISAIRVEWLDKDGKMVEAPSKASR